MARKLNPGIIKPCPHHKRDCVFSSESAQQCRQYRKEYLAKYRTLNRMTLNQRHKQSYIRNRKSRLDYARNYRMLHLEKIKNSRKKYYTSRKTKMKNGSVAEQKVILLCMQDLAQSTRSRLGTKNGITTEECLELWTNQNGKCAGCDNAMELGSGDGKRNQRRASVDRINSSLKTYCDGNAQLMHVCCNIAKGDMHDNEFKAFFFGERDELRNKVAKLEQELKHERNERAKLQQLLDEKSLLL